ncbi:MAG: type 1 glutamine amidotransferase [Marmoricola sp.]
MTSDSTIDVVLVYPELLGTYGDRGNAAALVHRARARGLSIRVVDVALADPMPTQGDIYLIGGGEDAAMLLAWEHLYPGHGLSDAMVAGAACFGVCAGFQLLAHDFTGPDGSRREGLGLLDVRCGRLSQARAVGEVLADSVEGLDLGFLTGFENHQGDARLGPAARPLGRLVRGVGNGDSTTEGAVQGRVIGSYLHGPALVRNDGLADHLLQLVAGSLPPTTDEPVRRLRTERRAAALAGHEPRRRRLHLRGGH